MSRLQSRSQNGRRRPEWKAIKDLYHYEIDFTEEPISKSAGRPPPSKLLTGRQYRNIDDSSLGPNCVAARNCQNTLTEATFIRDANGVLSKWAQNQQQQQQQQQQPQQQQQQQRQYSEKILKILKSARIESRQNPGEAYDAYLVVEGVGAFGICLQMHARFTTGNGAKGALQDNYTFKKQPYVIKTNQLAICFTGQRFFVATGGDVDKYLKSLPDGGDGVDRFQMGVGGLPVEPCNDMNSLFLEIATLIINGKIQPICRTLDSEAILRVGYPENDARRVSAASAFQEGRSTIAAAMPDKNVITWHAEGLSNGQTIVIYSPSK